MLLCSSLFCLPVSAVAQNVPSNALTFTDISGMFPLLPLAVSKSTIVGFMCCQDDAAYDENLVGFAQSRSALNYPSLGLLGRPLAGSSFATGVNASGTVVGSMCGLQEACGEATFGEHAFAAGNSPYGYILTPMDFPGAESTIGGGINSLGVIVGSYCVQKTSCATFESEHGFKFQGGVFTTVDFPGAKYTSINAINDSGYMVGVYGSGSQKAHGFLFQNGVFTPLDVPNAVRFENFESINNAGVIVGTYTDAKNISHGFEYVNGVYTDIDFPNATSTTADGIDDQGEIVGSYFLSTFLVHGYLAK
jgi:probable HAF family extracellular repeat protein